jgi:hypothetical protein
LDFINPETKKYQKPKINITAALFASYFKTLKMSALPVSINPEIKLLKFAFFKIK